MDTQEIDELLQQIRDATTKKERQAALRAYNKLKKEGKL